MNNNTEKKIEKEVNEIFSEIRTRKFEKNISAWEYDKYDFSIEMEYAKMFCELDARPAEWDNNEEILKLAEDINFIKPLSDIYKKSALKFINLFKPMSDTNIQDKLIPILLELIEASSKRFGFYLSLTRRLNAKYVASQMIIDKLVSGKLKPPPQNK